MAHETPALRMTGVSKRFPGSLAVDHVDFEARVGEVHALMGENGAGKSTLMRILAGSFDDYTGQVEVGGRPVTLHSPAAARDCGIAMIYQELSLARKRSIAENVLAGRLPCRRFGWLDTGAMLEQARACLARVGLDLDPRTPVEEISQHEAQLVEIARALGHVPCILVMDEPTSALSREEVDRLFEIILNLKRTGLSIVYISHHLPEVFRVADRVTVLRDGKRVGTYEIGDVTHESLIEAMVGGAASEHQTHRGSNLGAPLLHAEHLSRYGFFHDVNLTVHEGEIVGIAGLNGAGRTELARAMCGIDPLDEGRVVLNGEALRPRNAEEAIRRGLAYLTEDRKTQGLALGLPVEENIVAAIWGRLSRRGVYRRTEGRAVASRWVDALHIQPPDLRREAGQLSGGNQQKVLLAKWLATGPRVLVLDEPTRGVDVGAKAAIHRAIADLARQGRAIVLVSSDLPELASLSHRAIVLREGRVIGELRGDALTPERILLAASGQPPPAMDEEGAT